MGSYWPLNFQNGLVICVTNHKSLYPKPRPLPSLPWPLGHVRLISFLGLVCAALLFFSTC